MIILNRLLVMDNVCFVVFFTLLVIVCGKPSSELRTGPKSPQTPTARLHKNLLMRYDKLAHPTDGTGNATTVHFNILLNDINDVKEGTLQSIIKASVWVSMRWKDERLAWSLGQYPMKTIIIDPNKIWIPDIRLYNSLEPKPRMDDKVKAILYHDGSIVYDLPMWLSVHCHRPRGPNATWECPFKFGSWVYHGYQLDIFIHNDGMDLADGTDTVWGITGNEVQRKAITRTCCREPWPQIIYKLRLIRR